MTKIMIDQREVLATAPFRDWHEVYMRLVQKSDFEWVVETVAFHETGIYTKERLFLTREYGSLAVTFLYESEWATDAMELLKFAMEHLGHY
jgi:uncharacterized protein YecA (UPF0149 family)